MSLQIKNMDDVFNNLVEWITAKTDKISDFNVGSAVRTLTEAISIQFEEFYFDMKQNILYAIENSVYSAFGFDRAIATNSRGYVTVKFSKALPDEFTFPKGTVFCTSAIYGYLYFESEEEFVAPREATQVMIPVVCKVAGTIGNVPAGAIDTIVTTNDLFEEVTNQSACVDGKDYETSSERKKRFQNYVKTLARGTADSIVYGALEVEGVSGAKVDDNYIGYVRLYAHNSDGELPPELKVAILNNVQNYRSGGIEVEVLPISKRLIDIDLTIILGNDYSTESYQNMIYSLITTTLNDYTVSNSFYMSDLIHSIKNVYDDMVVNIIINSGKDEIISANELIRAGDITISCINLRDWRA